MPVEVIRSCSARGIEVFVAALAPFADPGAFHSLPHISARIGEAGKMLGFFRDNGVRDLVMAGGIRRPSLRELLPDWEGTKILAKIALGSAGDDQLFRALTREVESRGFRIRGIEEVAPEMMFHSGVYTRKKPSKGDMTDIRRGVEVARALGAVDVGQAVVVQEGRVLAVEAVEGTDQMLARAAQHRKPGRDPVMVKIKKPGQDTRTDMPAMGIQTVEQLKKHGMAGIAVESGGILLIEREAVVELADREGVFIIGMEV